MDERRRDFLLFLCVCFFSIWFRWMDNNNSYICYDNIFFSRSLFFSFSLRPDFEWGVHGIFFIRLMPRLQMHTDINNYLAIFWAYNSAFSTFCLRLIHPSCRMMNLQQIMCYALQSTNSIFRYSFFSYSFVPYPPYPLWLSIYRKRDEWNEPS